MRERLGALSAGGECHRCGGSASRARPAPEMGDRPGRSPGSRVGARACLPGPLGASGASAVARRLQLRGQPRHGPEMAVPRSLFIRRGSGTKARPLCRRAGGRVNCRRGGRTLGRGRDPHLIRPVPPGTLARSGAAGAIRGRIGKPVQIRRGPAAVRGTGRTEVTGHPPGKTSRRGDPKPEDRPDDIRCAAGPRASLSDAEAIHAPFLSRARGRALSRCRNCD